jgi:deoxyribose-phosphate aldolase
MNLKAIPEMDVKAIPELSSADDLVRLFDHAILHPTFTDADMLEQIAAVRRYPIASVCIKPYAVAMAVEALRGTSIAVGTVIAFPHGSSLTEVKAAETAAAFRDGAVEVDVVVNMGKVLSSDWDYVYKDLEPLVKITRAHGGKIKVIFETDFLTSDDLKIRLCQICSEIGVDYVKTSTGFGFVKHSDGYRYQGATEHDVALMRRYVSSGVGVKPSGAMRTLDRVLRMVSLGATRIGTASTAAIYAEALKHFGR